MFKGKTVVVIASGPSLTAEDCAYIEGRAKSIAINDNYLLAPFADIHFFCDPKWWRWHRDRPEFRSFKGLRVCLQTVQADKPPYPTLHNHGTVGLCEMPWALHNGRNSGHMAVNLAYHTGASRIVLLGFDMKAKNIAETHWFGNHPIKTKYTVFRTSFIPHFRKLAEDLQAKGIEVINATRDSDLPYFPRGVLRELI